MDSARCLQHNLKFYFIQIIWICIGSVKILNWATLLVKDLIYIQTMYSELYVHLKFVLGCYEIWNQFEYHIFALAFHRLNRYLETWGIQISYLMDSLLTVCMRINFQIQNYGSSILWARLIPLNWYSHLQKQFMAQGCVFFYVIMTAKLCFDIIGKAFNIFQ